VSGAPEPALVQIEKVGPEHLAAIAVLAAIIWRAHYPGIISNEQIGYMLSRMYDVEVMRKELKNGIAYDRLLINRELCGFASYGPTPNNDELKLHKLYVHPDCQRRGYGARLLNRVESVARERGLASVVLTVNKRNAKAIAAYRKNGFTIRESIVTDIGGGFVMDDYVMVKSLP
jgi:diamine N-acetyltransferase